MGRMIPPRPPKQRPQLTDVLRDAEQILNEELWLPVYEEGGVEALYHERLIVVRPPDPGLGK